MSPLFIPTEAARAVHDRWLAENRHDRFGSQNDDPPPRPGRLRRWVAVALIRTGTALQGNPTPLETAAASSGSSRPPRSQGGLTCPTSC